MTHKANTDSAYRPCVLSPSSSGDQVMLGPHDGGLWPRGIPAWKWLVEGIRSRGRREGVPGGSDGFPRMTTVTMTITTDSLLARPEN